MDYSLAADIVVSIHLLWVLCVLVPVPLIITGHFRNWEFIRNNLFRNIHMVMMLIVAVQALLNIMCPLTVLEQYLRNRGGLESYEGSFMGDLIHRILFYNIDPAIFTVIYVSFFIFLVFLYIKIPPEWIIIEGNKS